MALVDYLVKILDLGIIESDNLIVKIDEASSSFGYIGVASPGSLTSEARWRIARVVRQGSEYTIEYASTGYPDQIWDDRTTLFPPVTLNNAYSVKFDGVNDYVTVGNNYGFEHSQAFSISFWVKPDNVAAFRCMVSKVSNDVNVYGYSLSHTATGALYLQMRATTALLLPHTFTSTLTAGVWQHVVLTYTGASNLNAARVYINAVVGDTPGSAVLSGTWGNANSFNLGNRGAAATFPFVGNIDEVSVYDKALSASEVTELYNGGQPGDLNNYSAYANLLSWWRMGDNDIYPTILDNKGSVNGTMTNQTSADIVSDVP